MITSPTTITPTATSQPSYLRPIPPAHSSPTVKMRGNFKVMRRRSQFRLSLLEVRMESGEAGGSYERPPSASERMLIINLQGDAGGRWG